jgi:hypothetical protein
LWHGFLLCTENLTGYLLHIPQLLLRKPERPDALHPAQRIPKEQRRDVRCRAPKVATHTGIKVQGFYAGGVAGREIPVHKYAETSASINCAVRFFDFD